MTSLSLVPEIAKFNNITFKNLIKKFWKMLQLKNKNKVYFYIIAFLFLSTITNNTFVKSFNKIFLVNKINIDIKKHELNKIISSETNFLKTQNIFFINQRQIINKLSNLNFLENISIRKSYPSTLIIKQTKLILLQLPILMKKY